MDEMERYYQILGLKHGATEPEIMVAHRDLVKVWSPDRFAGDLSLQQKAREKLKEINEAYNKLLAYRATLQAQAVETKAKQFEAPQNRSFESSQASPKAPPGPAPGSIPFRPPAESLVGVGGWLLLLCIFLTVLWPLVGLAYLVHFGEAYPKFVRWSDQFPGILPAGVLDVLVMAGLKAFGVYVGISLWRIRPRSVQLAQKYLLVCMLYSLLEAFFPYVAGLSSELSAVMVKGTLPLTFGSMIGSFSWYLYLYSSKRVKATYGNGFETRTTRSILPRGTHIAEPMASPQPIPGSIPRLEQPPPATTQGTSFRPGGKTKGRDEGKRLWVVVSWAIVAIMFLVILVVIGGMESRSNKKTQCDSYIREANSYYEKGQYDQAIENYAKAIAIDPNSAVAYYNRGNAYCSTGRYDLAMDDCNKAIAIDPNLAVAYAARGKVYCSKRRYDLAIDDCSKAIAIDPNLAVAYRIRGGAYLARNEGDLGIDDCSKAIALDPHSASAYWFRGYAYQLLGNRSQAIMDWRVAANMGDKDAQEVLLKMGERW